MTAEIRTDQTPTRVDSTPAVVGFGLLFAGIALFASAVLLGQPMSRAMVVQALLIGWFAASAGLRVGDHLISREGRPPASQAQLERGQR